MELPPPDRPAEARRGPPAGVRRTRGGLVELRQAELFVVLARHGSFTRAAEAMGLAQPALSQQLKRLEQDLGVTLVDRSRRPIRLTEAGAALRLRAERMLAEAAMAREEMREFAGAGRGRVAIGALPALAALWLPPILARFHAAHPGIDIALRQGYNDELARSVATGELDAAVLHAVPGQQPARGSASGLMLERLFDEQLVVVVPVDHPLARRRSVSLVQLRHEPFVLVPQGSGLAHTVVGSMAALGFSPSVAAEAPDVATTRSLVAAGLGISIMPRLPAEGPGPPVGVVAITPALPAHTTALAWRGDSRPSAATEALLATVRAHQAGLAADRRRRARAATGPAG